jgi:hypothetical protein
MTIQTFLRAFWLSQYEFNNLNQDQKKIVARERLKVKNGKRDNEKVFEEIIKEILADEKVKREERDIKSHNSKIDALIAQKQDEELTKMSIDDLIKLNK